ncbi:protein IWS1 homolog 1-like [Solanum dulcamara]|nr:protein IWS1 homolog 1-like [Solanum dulcamara]
MSYNNDPYIDEEGEALVDFDEDVRSDNEQQEQFLGDNLDDDDAWNERQRERSPTPVYDDPNKSKPRKRLIKKSSARENTPDIGIGDEEDAYGGAAADDMTGLVRDESDGGGPSSSSAGDGKRKRFGMEFSEEKRKEKKRREKGEKKFKLRKNGGYSGGSRLKDQEGDQEMKEMWDTIAGGDSEDDQEGPKTADDDNFIDDSGVDPADRYGSDNEPRSPSSAPQAEEGEEDDEIKQLFKGGKKKKKTEKSAAEIALLVENVMAELEVVAEEDAELNRHSKPAINKLKKLPLLIDVLSKKQLQQEFLDHGVLTLLRTWLEPLPDGSLPNINIRAAILKILTDYPIDLEQYDRREMLKKSGLGKVIMFLSKSDEETTSNRKLAKDLVDKWSRPIFNKSTRFEDMRNLDDERAAQYRRPMKKPMNKASGMESRDDDLDLAGFSQGQKSGQSSGRQLTSRPEAMSMDFVVRPQSKIDPEEVRARARAMVQDQRRMKMNKKLQQLKAPKKKKLQATKLSVEGRGMVKYL